MPKALSRKELIRKLSALGFAGPFPGGRHEHMKKENHRVFIPNSHGKDIGAALVSEIVRQIGVSREEWEQL